MLYEIVFLYNSLQKLITAIIQKSYDCHFILSIRKCLRIYARSCFDMTNIEPEKTRSR